MASRGNVKGMLLEEIVLYLLEASGYRTVDTLDPNDSTLSRCSAGLEVAGRGEKHQIDAIADFTVAPPFSYPQRLLVEAKCYTDKLGIDIVRNAVGVIKDVCEFWPPDSTIHKQRYHYQYAIFSPSGFSRPAQRYAYAQDIYLIPITSTRYFQKVYVALNAIGPSPRARVSERGDITVSLKELRRWFRHQLRGGTYGPLENPWEAENAASQIDGLEEVLDETRGINGALIGMISKRFPVFLVPEDENAVEELMQASDRNNGRPLDIVIRWTDRYNWYVALLEDPTRRLFSFELPAELFLKYAENKELSQARALDLKREEMLEIQVTVTSQGSIKVCQLELDRYWLEEATYRLREEQRDEN